jgi:excinuclease ABC subunit A
MNQDVRKLLIVLHGLVAKGNSVLVIEHNLDLIKTADHIIDMGPEGGIGGGLIIAEGTPEQIANTSESYTGQWLKKVI